jgi:hypothetical protein
MIKYPINNVREANVMLMKCKLVRILANTSQLLDFVIRTLNAV